MRDVSMRPYTAVALAAALALAGCANPPELLTIEVSVTGLASNGLHIRNSVTNGDAYFGAGDTSGQIRIPKVSKPDPHEAGSNESVFEWALAIQKQPVGDTCELGGAVTGRLVADSNKLGQQKVTLTITCHPAGTVFTHSLGGTVNGLTASGLVLANGAAQLPVTPTTGGPVLFQFADQLAQGTTYDVSVATQPAGQTCAVAAGSGTMGSADIANVVVTCSARTGQIAVDVTGLGAASGLKLANNQVEQEVPGGSTLFTFPDQVPVGAQYSLAVTASPASLVCSLPATSGTFPASSADGVLNVGTVSCAVAPPPTYRIGGHVNGLVGSGLQLALNGGNALAISADGAFAFGNQLQSGAAYAVTVLQDPSGQTCGVTAGSGTVASADVTGVQVNCTTTPTSFTVGGSILGLTGPGLMLIDGETSEMLGVIAGAAQFTFPTGRSPGSLYDVFVYGTAHPVGQWCDVANGQGTVASSNVTSIAVTCANAHQIGGTVSGLALASQVWVRNDSTNATETLPIVANGAFVMSLPVVAGGSYSFSIDTQPPGQTCLITNGSGTMPAADVATVSIVCTP